MKDSVAGTMEGMLVIPEEVTSTLNKDVKSCSHTVCNQFKDEATKLLWSECAKKIDVKRARKRMINS